MSESRGDDPPTATSKRDKRRASPAELESDSQPESGQKVAKKSGVFAAGQAVMGLSQLATAVILTRSLDKTTFADISLLILIYSSAIGIGSFNLHQSIFYFFGRLDRGGQKRFMIQTSQLLAGIALLASLGLLAFELVGPMWGFEIAGHMKKLALVVILELPTISLANALVARDRAGQAALVNTISGLAVMAALVIPMVMGWGIATALTWLLIYASARVAAFLVLLQIHFPVKAAPRVRGQMRAQMSYTLPLGFAMLTGILNRQIDKYLVAAFCDRDDFAVYFVGAQEIPLVTVLPYSVGAVLMIQFVRGYIDGDKTRLLVLWHQAVSNVSLAVLPLVVFFLLVADDLVVLLFDHGYAAAALPFRIYTLILLHRVAEYGLVLRAAGDTRSLWTASGILLGSNLVLSLPLVLWLGMPGPAVATLLANIPAWLYVLHRIGGALDVGLRQVFPWQHYLKVLGVSALAGLCAYPVVRWSPGGPGLSMTLGFLAFLLAYLTFVRLFRIADLREWLALIRRSRKKTGRRHKT